MPPTRKASSTIVTPVQAAGVLPWCELMGGSPREMSRDGVESVPS
jgi:hypothetical protein